MKKILILITCLLLLSTLVFSVSATESKVTLTPSLTEVKRGDTFTISAVLSNTQEIDVCAVTVSYDTDAFELIGGSCTVDNTATEAVIPAQKVGTFILDTPEIVNGKIFSFDFRVKDNAGFDHYEITADANIGLDKGTPIDTVGTTVEVVCVHDFGDWAYKNEDMHESTCPICKETKEEKHNWNTGDIEDEATCTTPGEILYTCLNCGTTKTDAVKALGHAWDNDCDTSCNRCGETRVTEHKFSTKLSFDETGHFNKCEVCGEKGTAEPHIPGPPATDSVPQTCTQCGYEMAPASSHEHIMSVEWITDAEYHWHRCEKRNPTCLHTEDRAPHDYDNGCDVDCNTCGYIRIPSHTFKPEWQGDETGHWKLCALCGAKSDVKPHNPGLEATLTTPQVCEDCNYWVTWPLSHQHTYGPQWQNDDQNHWKSCQECGHVEDMEIHQWDAGTVIQEATETETGLRQWTCIICGKQVSEVIPALGSSNTPTEPVTDSTNPGGNQSEGGGFPWQIAGIAAIALLVVGIILLIIEFIRSSKTNMKGKFSK